MEKYTTSISKYDCPTGSVWDKITAEYAATGGDGAAGGPAPTGGSGGGGTNGASGMAVTVAPLLMGVAAVMAALA